MPFLAQSQTRSLRRRLGASIVGGLAALLISSTSAHAQGLIRDAEIEALLRSYAKPILNAAGLGSQGIRIHIVNDRHFNAFVVDGHNMFMHAGTLMNAKTPNQVIGVIAHECGHITGGQPGIGQAGMGVAYGGTDATMRTLLAYRQNEESSADQAAVRFLNATKQSGRGMIETFEFMASKLVGVQGIDPYLQSHPLPNQRIVHLRELVAASPYYNNI